jgi:predicted phosphodiesterase
LRIAAFSDVHSNLFALEAVLEDIERLGKDVQVIVAGDFLNCGPFPRETLALIRAIPNAIIIQGNHEGYVLEQDEKRKEGPLPVPYRALLAPSGWTASQLTPSEIEWLKTLPERVNLPGPDGTQIKIVHGSPRMQTEGIRPTLDETALEDIFDGEIVDRTLWISGHTHRTLIRRWCNMTITNNGSVGLPLDSDRRASYLVAEWDEKRGDWHAEHRRLEYDVERAHKAFLQNASYDQSGPFMHLIAFNLKLGRDFGLGSFIKAYSDLNNYPAPPDDFPHLEQAIHEYLAKYE